MTQRSADTYTVMAGCGVGEFLWRRDGVDTAVSVGRNVFSLMDRASDQDLISVELFGALSTWAKDYMAGQPKDWADPWDIDWEHFHARGIELARRLKTELGPYALAALVRVSAVGYTLSTSVYPAEIAIHLAQTRRS